MSGEINLQPAFGKDLENAVENITPAFGRDHVTCKSLTIDQSYIVRGEMEIEYKGEIDNPAHNPLGVSIGGQTLGVGPPSYEATWTIRYWWQTYYLNTLASDIQVQAAGELPAVTINTPFVQQTIASILKGHAPDFGHYVQVGSPPEGAESGGILEFPPESAYKDFAIIRFLNQTPYPMTVNLQWGPNSGWLTANPPSGQGCFWWVVTDQHFWQVFAATPPMFNINNGFSSRVPQVQVSKQPDNPIWETKSTVSGNIECNIIRMNDAEQFDVTPGTI